MCRWLAYIGAPISPKKYLYDDQYSLIEQSLSARKSRSIVNGDGFGFGWYGDNTEPGLFREVMPAWNDDNLKSLSCQIKSGLFLAHVRAATDTASNRSNCHPFQHRKSLFMHNGQIGNYLLVRRQVENLIPDHLYSSRKGSTDSEAIFLYLEFLMEKLSFKEATCQLIESVGAIMAAASIAEAFRYTAAYSDGESLYAVKFSTDDELPSLYYRKMDFGWLVVSEPLDSSRSQWLAVPDYHVLQIKRNSEEPILERIPCRHDPRP